MNYWEDQSTIVRPNFYQIRLGGGLFMCHIGKVVGRYNVSVGNGANWRCLGDFDTWEEATFSARFYLTQILIGLLAETWKISPNPWLLHWCSAIALILWASSKLLGVW